MRQKNIFLGVRTFGCHKQMLGTRDMHRQPQRGEMSMQAGMDRAGMHNTHNPDILQAPVLREIRAQL